MKPGQCAQPISPLVGEMSGRTEGGDAGANAAFSVFAALLLTPLCHLSVTSPPQGGRSKKARGTVSPFRTNYLPASFTFWAISASIRVNASSIFNSPASVWPIRVTIAA